MVCIYRKKICIYCKKTISSFYSFIIMLRTYTFYWNIIQNHKKFMFERAYWLQHNFITNRKSYDIQFKLCCFVWCDIRKLHFVWNYGQLWSILYINCIISVAVSVSRFIGNGTFGIILWHSKNTKCQFPLRT